MQEVLESSAKQRDQPLFDHAEPARVYCVKLSIWPGNWETHIYQSKNANLCSPRETGRHASTLIDLHAMSLF